MSLPQEYNLLARFPNPVYIETGIYRGDSLQMALDAKRTNFDDIGEPAFETIIGIDNDSECIEFCHQRFDLDNFPGIVNLVWDNSVSALSMLLTGLENDATIFLDAHWQMTGYKPENAFPLMKELEAIMLADRMNDTIIIDDILYMTHPDVTGWKLKDIKNALLRINTKYKFELIANPIVNNLLVAYPI